MLKFFGMGGGEVMATELWSEAGCLGVISFRGKSLSVGSPFVVFEAVGDNFFLFFFTFMVDGHLLTMAEMGKKGNHHITWH